MKIFDKTTHENKIKYAKIYYRTFVVVFISAIILMAGVIISYNVPVSIPLILAFLVIFTAAICIGGFLFGAVIEMDISGEDVKFTKLSGKTAIFKIQEITAIKTDSFGRKIIMIEGHRNLYTYALPIKIIDNGMERKLIGKGILPYTDFKNMYE